MTDREKMTAKKILDELRPYAEGGGHLGSPLKEVDQPALDTNLLLFIAAELRLLREDFERLWPTKRTEKEVRS